MTSHADGILTADLADILDATRTDPDLQPMEREWHIGATAVDDMARFYTEEPSLARRLLLHPHAVVDELRVSDPPGADRESRRFGARLAPEQYESGLVTGVKARIPIGTVKIRESPRTTGGLARLVTKSVLDNDPRKDGGDDP